MALDLVDINDNFSGLTGVYRGQGDTPVFLGQKAKSWVLDVVSHGQVAVGLDTRVSPGLIRIFLDKGTAIVPGTEPEKYYGLVMTREFRFDGLPVPPSILSPSIAFQDKYSSFVPQQRFFLGRPREISSAYAISMMSPDILRANQVGDPYFAYNATGFVNDFQVAGAFSLNQFNGFMATIPPGTDDQSPLCASLFAPVGLEAGIPSLTFIQNRLAELKADEIDPIATYEALSQDDYNDGKLIPHILAALEALPSDVLRVQMIGAYPLLTMMDDEGVYPVLLADPETRAIYRLEIDELEDLEFQATSDLFERFIDFANANGNASVTFPRRPGYFLRSYGKSQRMGTMLSAGPHTLECHYKVYAVGRGSIRLPSSVQPAYHCFGGVAWALRRTFDKENLQFSGLEFSEPKELPIQDVVNYNVELSNILFNSRSDGDLPELSNYLRALNTSLTGTSDQNVWFSTYPPVNVSVTDL